MILDLFFKIIISSSLPPSWDAFTQAYIAETRWHAMHDLFKNMNSQEFISIIKAEAECQGVACMSNATNLVYSTKAKNNKSKGQSQQQGAIWQKAQETVLQTLQDERVHCKWLQQVGWRPLHPLQTIQPWS